MIVGSKRNPENNGKTVRVLRVAAFEERPPEANAVAKQKGIRFIPLPPEVANLKRWWVEPVHGLLQWRSARGRVDADCAARSYKEKFLIRLDDDEAPKEVTRTVVKNAPKSKPVDEVI